MFKNLLERFLESSKELKLQRGADEKQRSEIWDSGLRQRSYSTFMDLEEFHFRREQLCLLVN